MATDKPELFPASPRVHYENAPLIQVTAQLRFPPLLSIESKPPVEFQERIRSHFPLMQKVPDGLPPGLPPEVAQVLRAQTAIAAYNFMVEDRTTTVTLTPQSLALSTTNYTRWEDFRNNLRVPLAALSDQYRPSFFSRIGLRYQNAIDRVRLGLSAVSWSELLRREILGELALPQLENNLEGVVDRKLRFKNPDGSGSVAIHHGLANVQGHDGLCYVIDTDFFTNEKKEIANAEAILNHFNELAGVAFRWCITDKLRGALRPTQLAAASG
jgi:uncharacterized protein (TIGR04255 family)